ncbi:MAG: hypothetical protein ACXAAM_00005 [Candidatus Heimdallarchaeaceae archaeon]|jgi:membrane-bound metal-dependent hydrolase YbcI (DUF457 family)
MPFTPFHLGFGVFVFSILIFLDPIALLLGTILIDVEAFMRLILNLDPLHGILHSMLGVMVFFIPTVLISWGCYKIFKLEKYLRKFNWGISIVSSLIGLFSHVFFDSILYPEVMMFYPFSNRSGILLGAISRRMDYNLLVILFCAGVIILSLRYFIKRYRKKKEDENLIVD